MPYTPPPPSSDWLQLRAILAEVEKAMPPGCCVVVTCYFMSQTPRDPELGYLNFRSNATGVHGLETKPGIPKHALHKTQEIAAWIVREIRKQYPEWFQ